MFQNLLALKPTSRRQGQELDKRRSLPQPPRILPDDPPAYPDAKTAE
jgi:hypothetical protein